MTTEPDPRTAPVRILLVHGSCHGGWCWEEVVGPLEERGWLVSAPDLPLTSFFDDAEAVEQEIAAAKARGERVVAVGHSYGCPVITQGGDDADHLVICAGPVPDIGETVDDERAVTPEVMPADVYLPGGMFTLDPERAVAGFFHRCTPEQARRAGERMRPMPAASFTEHVTKAAWKHVPTSYIVTTDDHAFGTSFQRSLLPRVRDYVEFDCDHSLFYSATDQLVARLDEIATEVAARGESA
ncbi:alpha/beta fold hydrolase [Microbacterium sp. X-17]|uniref:alpha/beta fold hydrolase n=1 Tax=Microbacterium sp. X-17 TaxID=3144404 RepID=UPI0031F53AA5